MIWIWSATLSRLQLLILTKPVGWLAVGVGKLLSGMMSAMRSSSAKTDDGNDQGADQDDGRAETEKAKRKRAKTRGKKQRQEPVLVAGATPMETASGKPRRRGATKQETLDFSSNATFKLPSKNLLKTPGKAAAGPSKQVLSEHAADLETVLSDFSVKGTIGESRYGPVVTRYDLNPAPGTKSQRVIALADDIARSMSAVSARVATVPGRNVIGIELPNARRETVFLRELLSTKHYEDGRLALPLALGKDIGGDPVAAMP